VHPSDAQEHSLAKGEEPELARPCGVRQPSPALARTITSRGPTATACDSIAQIIERIAADARPGDVVVGMSNGPFENLHARLREALADRVK